MTPALQEHEARTLQFWLNPENISQIYYTTTITALNTLAVVSIKIIAKGSDKDKQLWFDTKQQKAFIHHNSVTVNHEFTPTDSVNIHNHYVKIYRNKVYPMEII